MTTLYSSCSQYECPDGAYPEGVLVQSSDGDLYGTTYKGGANEFQAGAIFKITADGTFTTVYSFFCSPSGCWDGVNPQAGLIQASNGDFYGTTTSRGPLYGGTLAAGTVFRITPSGKLTTLSGFTCIEHVCPNGTIPEGGLIQATDGNFYGTTYYNGASDGGTIFQITPSGTLTTLYDFACSESSCKHGEFPSAALVQASDGDFYGTTLRGGAGACPQGCGTVFRLSVGLGLLVETQPAAGKAGETNVLR